MKLRVARDAASTARAMVGRTIVDVDLHPFDPENAGQVDGDEYAYNPVVTLDDGTRLFFVVQESEIGEYGVKICRNVQNRKRKPRAAAGLSRGTRDVG